VNHLLRPTRKTQDSKRSGRGLLCRHRKKRGNVDNCPYVEHSFYFRHMIDKQVPSEESQLPTWGVAFQERGCEPKAVHQQSTTTTTTTMIRKMMKKSSLLQLVPLLRSTSSIHTHTRLPSSSISTSTSTSTSSSFQHTVDDQRATNTFSAPFRHQRLFCYQRLLPFTSLKQPTLVFPIRSFSTAAPEGDSISFLTHVYVLLQSH